MLLEVRSVELREEPEAPCVHTDDRLAVLEQTPRLRDQRPVSADDDREIEGGGLRQRPLVRSDDLDGGLARDDRPHRLGRARGHGLVGFVYEQCAWN